MEDDFTRLGDDGDPEDAPDPDPTPTTLEARLRSVKQQLGELEALRESLLQARDRRDLAGCLSGLPSSTTMLAALFRELPPSLPLTFSRRLLTCFDAERWADLLSEFRHEAAQAAPADIEAAA